MNLTDDALIQELSKRFAQSRKAFSDLNVVNRKLTEMNRRLEQSESLKSNFLSNIRNEINNPLNCIIVLAQELAALGSARADDGDVPRVASMICSEAKNLDFQMRNIFMAAELEAGDGNPHAVRMDVAAVVKDVADSFHYMAARKSIEIELIPGSQDEPLLFNCDSEKLHIMVANLLANALEFSREGGVVTVSFMLDEAGYLSLKIQDRGIGIAEPDLARIFDRFVQLETGTTRTHLGHGLGLGIVRALADLLQGTVAVESAPGKGSAFLISLPPTSIADDENCFSEGGNMFLFNEMSEK